MRVSTIKCFMLRCTFSSINIPIRHPVSAAYHFDTFLKKSVLYVILYRVWNNFFCGLCGRAYNLLPPDRPLLVFRHRLRGKPCVCVEDHHSLMGNLQHFVLMFWLSWSDRQKSLSFFFFFWLATHDSWQSQLSFFGIMCESQQHSTKDSYPVHREGVFWLWTKCHWVFPLWYMSEHKPHSF